MRNTFQKGILAAAAALAFSALPSACASTPLRTEASASGIRAAQEGGAANVPRAALHLQLAREELARARAMEADGRHDEGASHLMRAEADAELALALSHEDAEKVEARAAMARVQELQRNNPPSP